MRISHIQGRLEQQLSLSTLIFRSFETFTKIPTSELTSRVINARLTLLKDTWDKFSVTHDAIMISIIQLDPSEQEIIRNHSYFTNNIHSLTYERYLECLDRE